MGLQRTELMS